MKTINAIIICGVIFMISFATFGSATIDAVNDYIYAKKIGNIIYADQYATLQDALNETGNVVISGAYTITSTINIDSDTPYIDARNATFTLAPNADTHMFYIDGANIMWDGGKINANHQNQGAYGGWSVFRIAAGSSENVTIQNTNTYNVKGFSHYVFGGPTSRAENVRFIGNTVSQLSGANWDLIVPAAEGGQVSHNTVYVDAGLGINIYESNNVVTYGNTIYISGITGTGIAVSSSKNSPVYGNTINASVDAYCIKILKETDNGDARDQNDSYVHDNECQGSGQGQAIEITNANNSIIQNNILKDWQFGIVHAGGVIDSPIETDNTFIRVTTPLTDTISPINKIYLNNYGDVSCPGRTSSIAYPLDNGTSVIESGNQGYVKIPWDAEITGASILGGGTGNLALEFWIDSWANYPPTVADLGGRTLTLAADNKVTDTTLAGWTTAVSQDDVIVYNVSAVPTINNATVQLDFCKN